ncbi:MAG: hypothetical protein II146_04210, partial [Treponema sp.]|nr:hypothetical protein [Treponema sp.]
AMQAGTYRVYRKERQDKLLQKEIARQTTVGASQRSFQRLGEPHSVASSGPSTGSGTSKQKK